MTKTNVQQHKFVLKAGMTFEDVKKSKDATSLQKKYASAFDTDGIKGFSQKEADLFNATTFSEKADGSVTFWTRQKDGTKKGTKFDINDNNIQFKSDDEVKPYVKQITTKQTAKILNYSADDGKISTSDKAKNLVKGLASPITSMFESKENFLIGAGMIAGGALLIAATGGAAAPVLVTLGAGIGAVQAGVGVYKAATAKTDAEAEQAWQGIGAGTSAIALSALGAKSALKSIGINAEEMSAAKATAKCIKMTPESITASLKNAGARLENVLSDIDNFMNPNGGAIPGLAVAGGNIQYNSSGALSWNPATTVSGTITSAATIGASAIVQNAVVTNPTKRPRISSGAQKGNSATSGAKIVNCTYTEKPKYQKLKDGFKRPERDPQKRDPSMGMSDDLKTGVKDPKDIDFDMAEKTIDKSITYKAENGKTYYQCEITDGDTTVKYWGDDSGKMHTLIQVSRTSPDGQGHLTVNFPNGGKYSWGRSATENATDLDIGINDASERLCKDFANAASGFCSHDDRAIGVKYLYEGIYLEGHVNPADNKAIQSCMELKCLDLQALDLYESYSNCGKARFFAPLGKYDSAENTLTVNLDVFCPESPLHK